ncbi:MAG: hypothetical protein OTI35_17565, partial [Sulfitobacter sp.]|nr:hypothetical protein [Sulfitobacter sp.]
GNANLARLGKPLKTRGDVDTITHQIAVIFLDHITKVNAYTKLDTVIRRFICVSLGHDILNLDGAARGLNNTAKLDERAVASALHYAPAVCGNRRIDDIATQTSQTCEHFILICVSEATKTYDISNQNCCESPNFLHGLAAFQYS